MKRLLLPLLASFALPTAVNAGTWILLQSFSGYTRSIDASSVVKNGSWRYANLRYKGPQGGSITGIKINCKEEILYLDGLIFKRKNKDYWGWIRKDFSGEEYEQALPMVNGGDGALSEATYQFLCKEWK